MINCVNKKKEFVELINLISRSTVRLNFTLIGHCRSDVCKAALCSRIQQCRAGGVFQVCSHLLSINPLLHGLCLDHDIMFYF